MSGPADESLPTAVVSSPLPPGLQRAFDEAVAATRGATSGLPTDRVLERGRLCGWVASDHQARGVQLGTRGVSRVRLQSGGLGASGFRDAPADVDPAIAAFEAAVATVPNNSASRPAYLGSLGYALIARLSRTETIADRDAVIAAFEGALAGAPVNSPKRPSYLINLGIGLRRQFDSDGVSADLDAAIRAFEEVLLLTPVGSPDRPRYLANLAAALQGQFDAGGAPADLDAAIAVYQEAVDATPADDPDRLVRGSAMLGLGLRRRYDRGRASTDLDAAIATFAEAVETTPADAVERSGPPRRPCDCPARAIWAERRTRGPRGRDRGLRECDRDLAGG